MHIHFAPRVLYPKADDYICLYDTSSAKKEQVKKGGEKDMVYQPKVILENDTIIADGETIAYLNKFDGERTIVLSGGLVTKKDIDCRLLNEIIYAIQKRYRDDYDQLVVEDYETIGLLRLIDDVDWRKMGFAPTGRNPHQMSMTM